MKNAQFGMIFLIYKGKVLLMHKQKSVLDPVNHPWSLISTKRSKNESFEDNLRERIHDEMGIIVDHIEPLSKTYYYAKLTDKNVNNIQRSEHQLLDFFTLKEVKKLVLTNDTNSFIKAYPQLFTVLFN